MGKFKRLPSLVRLRYGEVYCELCRGKIRAGEPVGWWTLESRGRPSRNAVYCGTCHRANLRAGRALRARSSGKDDEEAR